MSQHQYPRGPLWVLIGLYFVLVSIDPWLASYTNLFTFSRYSYSDGWEQLAAGIFRGLALSELVLLAVWIAFAEPPRLSRNVKALGIGAYSLLIWLICIWLIPGRSYYVPIVSTIWTARLATLAPLLLAALAILCEAARRTLGWSIAGPLRRAAPPRALANLRVLMWEGLWTLFFVLGAYLLAQSLFLSALLQVWFRGSAQDRLAALGYDFCYLLKTLLAALPWLGLLLDPLRRWFWRVAAPAGTVVASAVGYWLFRSDASSLFYPGIQLGLALGTVGVLGLLAGCGWQLGSQQATNPPNYTPPYRHRFRTVARKFMARHAVLLILLGVSLTATFFSAYVIDSLDSEVIQGPLVNGMYGSLVVLLAVWASLSTTPIRIRIPAVATMSLGGFFLWALSLQLFDRFHDHLASQFNLLLACAMLAGLMLAGLLLRLIGGFCIVRTAPLSSETTDAPARQTGRQFTVRDLLLWTAVVALALGASQWLLDSERPHSRAATETMLIFALTTAGLLPALLCVGVALHAGRRWVWGLSSGLLLAAGPLVVAFFLGRRVLVWSIRYDFQFFLDAYLFQLGACWGVIAALTFLAATGYRLEGRTARRKAAQAEQDSPPTADSTHQPPPAMQQIALAPPAGEE